MMRAVAEEAIEALGEVEMSLMSQETGAAVVMMIANTVETPVIDLLLLDVKAVPMKIDTEIEAAIVSTNAMIDSTIAALVNQNQSQKRKAFGGESKRKWKTAM